MVAGGKGDREGLRTTKTGRAKCVALRLEILMAASAAPHNFSGNPKSMIRRF
jgi:hypothetical protein